MSDATAAQVVDKTLVVLLDQLFDESEVDAGSTMVIDMTKKRVFHKTIENFANEIDNAFKAIPGLALAYLTVVGEIDSELEKFPVTEDGRMALVCKIDEEICNFEGLTEYIFQHVEETFDINIESETNKENQLQFTNVYAKRIIASAMLSRIVFPILCHWMAAHAIKKEEDAFLELIARVFEYFNVDDTGEPLNLLMKLQKFVATSVDNTLYSDQVIWRYLKNLSINERTVALDIHRNLMCNIIPKLETNRSVVSFFHVVIKKQIEFQFTSNFKMSYKPIMAIRTDDENTNPFIKIEQRLVRNVSELNVIMIKEDVRNFIKKNNVLTDDELDYHLANVTIHSAQTRLVGFFISKVVGRGIPALTLSKKEYIQMLFIAKAWLEQFHYNFIGHILLGIPVPKHTVKRNFHKGKHLLEITQSQIYTEIEARYTLMGNKIDQSVIISFIGEIINTDFEFYTLPDGSKYSSKEVPTLKTVMVELLTFINTL